MGLSLQPPQGWSILFPEGVGASSSRSSEYSALPCWGREGRSQPLKCSPWEPSSLTAPPQPQPGPIQKTLTHLPSPSQRRHFQFFLLFSLFLHPPHRPISHWPSALSHPKSYPPPTLTPSSGGSSSQPSSPCAVLVSIRVTEGEKRGWSPPREEATQMQTTFLLQAPSPKASTPRS